jgi:hypothetical protein
MSELPDRVPDRFAEDEEAVEPTAEALPQSQTMIHRSARDPAMQLRVPVLLPLSSLPPNIRNVVATFGIAGWIGFWAQLAVAGIAALTLLLILPGRALGGSVNVPGTGLSLVLALCGLVWLGCSLYLGFRYTRVPRGLRSPDPLQRPTKEETVTVLRWGMWVDLAGAFLALIGVEVSVMVLLSKALTQPQGVAIYDPLRIIRPLDVMMVLSNVNILAGFLVGLLVSVWLLHRLHRD